MGNEPSVQSASGVFSGGCAQPTSDELPEAPVIPLAAIVPKGKKAGDLFTVNFRGRKQKVRATMDGGSSEAMQFSLPNFDAMIASTLPSPPPGFAILAQKPIVWASHTSSFSYTNKFELQAAGEVGPLLEETQRLLLTKAHELGCNAVLGMNFSIAVDSRGDRGDFKMFVCSGFATPCIIDGIHLKVTKFEETSVEAAQCSVAANGTATIDEGGEGESDEKTDVADESDSQRDNEKEEEEEEEEEAS